MKRNVTKEIFEAGKVLQNAGIKIKQAGIVLGKSRDTARRIYVANDWDDYQISLKALSQKQSQKKTPRVTEEKSSTPATPSIPLSTDLQESIIELILAVDRLSATIKGAVETKPKLFSFGGIK